MNKSRRSRTYNTRLIKRAATYTVVEIAELYSIHINSVRLWLADGLRAIDTKRPILIHGGDLAKFLNQKQAKRRCTCSPSEFYCFKCRVPRQPLNKQVTIEMQSERILKICGICEACGTPMNKAGSLPQLANYRKIFSVQPTGAPHLTMCAAPADNCDLEKEKILP